MLLLAPTCMLPSQELRKWNLIIKNQVMTGDAERAILTYVKMLELGLRADNYTFPILIKAAGSCCCARVGFALHGHTIKTGFSAHAFVETALLNFYGALCHAQHASQVFERMPVRDLVAWNSMLDVYVCNRQMDKAQYLFNLMPSKDPSSYNTMISGYSIIGAAVSATNVFREMEVRDIVSWNSMIMVHTRAGDVNKARDLFREMPVAKNVITWNTLINGCLQKELYIEALDLFDEMKTTDCLPDHLTVAAALSASAHLGSLEIGRKIHMYAVDNGLASSPRVATALIDMYAKCGSVEKSLGVFYKFHARDIYCWNVIISGLALHGHGYDALKLFRKMREDQMRPDDITFIGLLGACAHSGLVQQGCHLFGRMQKDFGIPPKLEHYGCLVDLLGRAGHLDLALQLVEAMPIEPGESILGALLSACVIHRDLEVGKRVIKRISSRAPHLNDGELMMFANLFASCGCWEEAKRWREMMNDSGIVKTAGCSIIEVYGKFEKFLAGKDGPNPYYLEDVHH